MIIFVGAKNSLEPDDTVGAHYGVLRGRTSEWPSVHEGQRHSTRRGQVQYAQNN